MNILRKVFLTIEGYDLIRKEEVVLAAVSGGPDSVALLALLKEINDLQQLGWQIHVGHFNHGLRGRADAKDEELVKKLAESLKLPFVRGSADVKALRKAEGPAGRSGPQGPLRPAARGGHLRGREEDRDRAQSRRPGGDDPPSDHPGDRPARTQGDGPHPAPLEEARPVRGAAAPRGRAVRDRVVPQGPVDEVPDRRHERGRVADAQPPAPPAHPGHREELQSEGQVGAREARPDRGFVLPARAGDRGRGVREHQDARRRERSASTSRSSRSCPGDPDAHHRQGRPRGTDRCRT